MLWECRNATEVFNLEFMVRRFVRIRIKSTPSEEHSIDRRAGSVKVGILVAGKASITSWTRATFCNTSCALLVICPALPKKPWVRSGPAQGLPASGSWTSGRSFASVMIIAT